MTAEKKKILIIDDDPDFVEGIKSILETAEPGYEVDAAYNPNDGLEALQAKRFDLLLLDIMMGRGAEGVMLARKMGADPVLRETPVLIITGIREQIAFLGQEKAAEKVERISHGSQAHLQPRGCQPPLCDARESVFRLHAVRDVIRVLPHGGPHG